MKKRFAYAVLVLTLLSGAVFSQEPILLSYQRNFVRASLGAKPVILRDAATDSRSAEFMGELYEFALQFILDNSELLYNDADMITLTGAVSRGISAAAYKESADTLWKIFLIFKDPYSRVEILKTLVSFGREAQFVEKLNQFITGQNDAGKSGLAVDYTTFSAAISAAAELRDASSFTPLFSGLLVGHPELVKRQIQTALESLEGNYRLTLGDIIYRNPPAEKLAALRLGAGGEKLTPQDRGELAQIALEVGLDFVAEDADTEREVSTLRYEAINTLAEQKWTRASPQAIRHFYRVQTFFQKDPSLKSRFLEAITCLGVMGTAESAQVLALQLGYYNSQTEHSGTYDYDIILTLVKALGEAGDKTAFDYLLYVSYLKYPEQIQAAAREALDRLKW